MRVLSFAITGAAFGAMLFAAPGLRATTRHKSVRHAAPAIAMCQYPYDREAFEIESLKSQLMVTALACKQQPKYNAFMDRYKPEVAREEHALNAYFKRYYGKSYESDYDKYITNLADMQEQDGLKAGNAYCANLPAMFDEVMALHDPGELPDYVNSKSIAQPIDFSNCPEAAPAVEHARHKMRAKRK